MMDKLIAGKDLRNLLRNEYRYAYVPPVDKSYFLPSRDFVMSQLVNATVRESDYMPETHDCDDYADDYSSHKISILFSIITLYVMQKTKRAA